MAVNDWLLIEKPNGAQYEVLALDFERNADGAFDGAKALSYKDGSEYLTKAERAEARAESKEAPKASEKAKSA